MAGWRSADVTRLRAAMVEQGRSIDEIAAEIRLLCRCSPLAAYRMAHGWSQPQAVEQYNTAIGVGYVDQPMLSRLERFSLPGEGRAPQAAQLIGWARLYGTTPLRLVAPEALGQLDAQERAVLLRFATTFEPSSNEHQEPEHAVVPRQIGLGTAATAGSLERQIAVASRKALRFAATAEGSNVGPETLDGLRDEVCRLARLYTTRPLGILLPDLIDTQDIAFRLLEGRQRPEESRDLYLAAGAVSAILAEASHHLGDIASARMQARAAFVCAENAGHNGLRAWTYGLQSLIAYWSGWPHEAIRYARLGAGLPTTGTSSAWLPALEARAQAALGDVDAARQALTRADAARQRAEADELDAFGGTLTFTRPRQMYYAADTTTWLPGQAADAVNQALEAIAACESAAPEERSYATEAGSRAVLALAWVDLQEVEGAHEALAPVLDLEPARRIRGVIGTAERIHAALRAPEPPGRQHTPAARRMQEEIEAFCQVAAATTLPRGR